MKKRSILVVSLGLLISTLAVSCGNQESNTPNTVVTKVEISNGTSIDLKANETKKLEVNLDKTGEDEVTLKFESLDPSVATVDNDGNIKGLKVGATAIIVRTNFNPEIFDVISVNVLTNEVNIPVTGIELNDIGTLTVGDTASLKVTVLPESATNKEVSFISLNEEIATVDNEGNVKALKAGETDIAVTSKDGGFTKVSHLIVSEVTIPLTALALDVPSQVEVGSVTALNVVYTPENTTQRKVTYSLAEESELAVILEGTLYAKQEVGTIKLKVTSVDNPEISSEIVSVKIVDSSTAIQEELKTKVNASFDVELDTINKVEYSNIEEDYEYGIDLSYEKVSYQVYNGPHYVVTKENYSNGTKSESIVYEGFNKEKDHYYSMELDSLSKKAKKYSEEPVTEVSQDQIINGTMYEFDPSQKKNGIAGFVEFKINDCFNSSKENFEVEVNKANNTYTINRQYVDGFGFFASLLVYETTISFGENGEILNFEEIAKEYSKDALDSSTGEIKPGSKVNCLSHIIVNAEYSTTRSDDYGSDISEDMFKIQSIEDLHFEKDGQVAAGSDFESGDTLKLVTNNVLPETASLDIDKLIIEIDNKDVAELTYAGDIRFKGEGTVNVKISSTYGKMEPITKTFNVTAPKPESIEVYLGSEWWPDTSMKVGETKKIGANVNPSEASQEVNFEIIKGSECGTIEFDESLNSNVFKATKAGEVTVKATSKVDSNISGTFDFVVEGTMSEEEFNNLVTGKKYEGSAGQEKFVAEFNTVEKKFTVDIYKDGTKQNPDQKLTSSYVFTNGTVTFSDIKITGEGYYDATSRKNRISFDVKSEIVTLSIYSSQFDTTTVTLYKK